MTRLPGRFPIRQPKRSGREQGKVPLANTSMTRRTYDSWQVRSSDRMIVVGFRNCAPAACGSRASISCRPVGSNMQSMDVRACLLTGNKIWLRSRSAVSSSSWSKDSGMFARGFKAPYCDGPEMSVVAMSAPCSRATVRAAHGSAYALIQCPSAAKVAPSVATALISDGRAA